MAVNWNSNYAMKQAMLPDLKLKSSEQIYTVLVGDAGSGKSTLIEKISGFSGQSSASCKSFTKVAQPFESLDGTIVICDTPGSNSISDQFQHNLHIAHALNFRPLHLILLTVKAEVRMDNVISAVRKYAEGFMPEDMPLQLIGVCITHMDTVSWKSADILPHLEDNLGIETVLFSSLGTTGEQLCAQIRQTVGDRHSIPLDVNGELFLRLFRIDNNNIKILREVRKEVSRFEKMKDDFYLQKAFYDKLDQMNMHFEFQAWMFEEIIAAQKRLSEQNNFIFDGPQIASEAGHIANMTNQLRKVLSGVRIEAMKYHKDVDTNFRKCPHCSVVWQKIEGCDGETFCGSNLNQNFLYDSWSENGQMSTFSFRWDKRNSHLEIVKTGSRVTRSARIARNQFQFGGGCGGSIVWENMAPVTVEIDFDVDPSSTQDVAPIAIPTIMETFMNAYSFVMKQMRVMFVKSKRQDCFMQKLWSYWRRNSWKES